MVFRGLVVEGGTQCIDQDLFKVWFRGGCGLEGLWFRGGCGLEGLWFRGGCGLEGVVV